MDNQGAKTRHSAALRGALATALALGLGCAGVGLGFEAPDVHVANITPLPGSAFEQRMLVELRVRNPNRKALNVEGMRFDVDLNGRYLGGGQSGEAFSIDGLSEAVIPVEVTTSVFAWAQQLLALAENHREEQRFSYAVYGDLFLRGRFGTLSFTRSGDFGNLLGKGQRPAQ